MVYSFITITWGVVQIMSKTHAYRGFSMFLMAFFAVALVLVSCSKPEEEQIVVTARFTDLIDIEPQPSDKCIACHTREHPINKLASDSVDSGHGGDGG